MPVLTYILAETDPTKFIGLAVVAVIWIIGMITQAIKKKSEEDGQRKPVDLSEEILRRLPPAQVPPRPQQQQSKQRPPNLPRQKSGKPDWNTIAAKPPALPPKLQKQKRQVAKAHPPRIQQPQAQPTLSNEAPAPPTVSAAKQTTSTQTIRKGTPFIDARALRRFLNPATLQQQYILTELLQRPMCDREQRD